MAGVFRIGELKALVDSCVKNGVIWEEVLLDHSCFNINNPSKYRFIGGTPVNNVVGEIILTVRYRGTIVDLPRVAVVRKRVYPFVLGVEWIVQSGDSIKGVGGVAEVVMPGAGLVSTVENKTGKSGVPKKAGDYKEAIEELSNIGEILEEVEKKKSGGNASVERSYVLKTASARVPANRMGYFKCKVHSANSKLWMGPTVGVVGVRGGWAIPSCVLVLNTKKCVFGAKRIVHLGHVVDSNGISPDPAKPTPS